MQQNSILEFLFFQDHFSEFAAAIYADLVSQFFSWLGDELSVFVWCVLPVHNTSIPIEFLVCSYSPIA